MFGNSEHRTSRYRARRMPSARDYLYAGVLTALTLIALGGSMHALFPLGCAVSDWLCVFPTLLLTLAPLAALCVSGLLALSQVSGRPSHVGWLTITFCTAVASQLLVSLVSCWAARDHLNQVTLFDVLIFPYALAVGALTGLAFGASLRILARR